MDLSEFEHANFNRGASRVKEAIWLAVSGALVSSWLPGSGWRSVLLRFFGASIGSEVTIKPRVRVKFPWRLVVADHVWIGEGVWIDNLDRVTIGKNSCISQGAYLCTGSHDWTDPRFALVTKPIVVGEECWVGARSILAPGTVMEKGAVLGMGALGRGVLSAATIHLAATSADTKPRPGYAEP